MTSRSIVLAQGCWACGLAARRGGEEGEESWNEVIGGAHRQSYQTLQAPGKSRSLAGGWQRGKEITTVSISSRLRLALECPTVQITGDEPSRPPLLADPCIGAESRRPACLSTSGNPENPDHVRLLI
ncbi:hypothetical protein VTK56DRAFT_4089 [Thermocarpiscus australiensis]